MKLILRVKDIIQNVSSERLIEILSTTKLSDADNVIDELHDELSHKAYHTVFLNADIRSVSMSNRIVEIELFYDDYVNPIMSSISYTSMVDLARYDISVVQQIFFSIVREIAQSLEGVFNPLTGDWIKEPQSKEYVKLKDKSLAQFDYCPKFDDECGYFKRRDGIDTLDVFRTEYAMNKYFKHLMI